MPEAKVQLMIGDLSFSCEGDQEWVGEQLSYVLQKASELTAPDPSKGSQLPPGELLASSSNVTAAGFDADSGAVAGVPLATFLKEKDASTVQVKKFLATAVWLTDQGQTPMGTGDVTRALRESQQSRLGNASECLNQSIAKGYCVRDGKQFYVTADGKAAL